MKAIISDIHGNLEALEAVLADVRQQGIRDLYCLGDVVGYGPNPRECIDLVMDARVCLLGNHDQGALFDPDGFNPGAERAIFWTRKQLESGDPQRNQIRWEFLGECPRTHREGKLLFVHGSARNPLNEYVFPEDIYNQRKMERIFSLVDHYCFQGHTHVPGVFTENLNFYSPEELSFQYQLGNEKVLVNVGSVGQPRNGDPRASYVVLDDGPQGSGDSASNGNSGGSSGGAPKLTFRRVEYDVEKTIAKIYAIPELDNFLGDRLRDGR
ncbi:MAG TPA: metallophosphoesterase family protein [Planctomycetaceae bacterium]|nr:metallophosphoesterase family protein [Planctomycetaceae bacterium]